MSLGSWLAGWVTGDTVSLGEFKKGVGCIFDSTLGAPAASFDLSSVPAGYGSLLIVAHLRGTTAAAGISTSVRFNNDSGANYDYQRLIINNTTVTGAAAVGQTSIAAAEVAAASASASEFGYLTVTVPNYAGTVGYKTAELDSFAQEGTTTAGLNKTVSSGRWKSTSAINRVTVLPASGNWDTGSSCQIYVLGK